MGFATTALCEACAPPLRTSRRKRHPMEDFVPIICSGQMPVTRKTHAFTRHPSMGQHDEICADIGLRAGPLVRDNEGGAGRYQVGNPVDGFLGDCNALECLGGAG
jgi:hypothetical protein